MKKLLIAATLTAAALGATPLLADTGHQHGQRQAGATADCPMAGAAGAERHAQMQARMAAMHAQAGEHQGRGAGAEHRGQHQNRGEGCPAQQAPNT